MTENRINNSVMQKDTGGLVIARVDELCKTGLTMPKDYNYVNAIKASMLVLKDIKDRNQRSALEVCTPASIQNAIFEMATKGLDVSKKQAYFIVRGNQLCLHPSYFGKILQVKRVYPNYEPVARVIYQGDKFVYRTDSNTGRRVLVEHEQKLENLDNDFIGAYLYLPCPDGEKNLFIMTRKQIYAAWAKSTNKSLMTHKEFPEKMVIKTIINSGCSAIINSTPELAQSADEEFLNAREEQEAQKPEDTDFEEINVDDTPEVEVPAPPAQHTQPEPQQEQPAEEAASDDDF